MMIISSRGEFCIMQNGAEEEERRGGKDSWVKMSRRDFSPEEEGMRAGWMIEGGGGSKREAENG